MKIILKQIELRDSFRSARFILSYGLLLFLTACSINSNYFLPTSTSSSAETTQVVAASTQKKPVPLVSTQTSVPTPSRTPTPTPTSFPLNRQGEWTSYTNPNFIRAMLVDREGNLWTGGSGGVVYWNVRTGVFDKYTVENGLADNFVTSIAQDNHGMLWFGTYGSGVSRFDGQSWVTFTTQDGLIDNTVLSIWAARGGSLWFGTLNGVSTYDGQNWRSFSIRTTGDPVANVDAITETPDGRLWFGSIHGALKSYFKGQWQIENISGVTALAVSPDGSLWVGTLESVLHWNNIAWESFPSEGQVSSIAVSPNGYVWVGYSLIDTLGMSREALDLTDYPFPQVSRYDGKEWVQLEPPAGLLEEDVRSIQVGPNGTVWFGSFSRGVVSYDGSVWHTLQIKNQHCSNFIQKLAVFQDEIWFGYPGGISHFDGQRWECLTQLGDLEIKQNPIFVIHIDPESGDVWVGTMKGLAIFNSTDWITYSSTQYPWLSAVAAIVSLPDNSFLIGSDEGVYQFDGEKWNALWAVQKSVETIQVAGDGSLWLGSTFGIYSSKGDNWKHFDQVSGTISMATGIFRAPDGTLWIASCPEGLAQLVGNTWKVYSGEGGDLLGGCVLGLTIDQGGIVWAGTTVGLSKYNGEVWNTYQTQDGLANNYVQDVTVDSNGEIWVATIAGISHYSELKIGRSNFLENVPMRKK